MARHEITTVWEGREDIGYLLTEALGKLLTEDGEALILDESVRVRTVWE